MSVLTGSVLGISVFLLLVTLFFSCRSFFLPALSIILLQSSKLAYGIYCGRPRGYENSTLYADTKGNVIACYIYKYLDAPSLRGQAETSHARTNLFSIFLRQGVPGRHRTIDGPSLLSVCRPARSVIPEAANCLS